ncbi:uncharacterized protein LOC131878026, partial [Tigriopus californicus]|uniref:uncharacterized protein LOC131878026 n=1 Tax=Tigriopus californicus TaxID=6832 RepID=UPI0027DA552E
MTPPQPNHVNIHPIWDGNPIPFFANVSYVCSSSGLFFQEDRDHQSFQIQCLEGGQFDVPKPWPACVRTTYCGAPLPKPIGGTREWNGDQTFETEIEYTCGPFGQFRDPVTNSTYEEIRVTCQWDTTWSVQQLDRCVYSHCEHIPEPPVSSGINFVPVPRSRLQLISPHSRFTPLEEETVLATQQFGESDVFVAEGILSIDLMSQDHLPSFFITDINDTVVAMFSLDPYQSILIVQSDHLPGTLVQMFTSLSVGERFKLVVGFNRNRNKMNIKLNYEQLDDFELPNNVGEINFKSAYHVANRTTRFIGFGHAEMDTFVSNGTTITYKCPENLYFDFDLLRKPFYALECTDNGYFLHTPERWPTCVDPFETTTILSTPGNAGNGTSLGRK